MKKTLSIVDELMTPGCPQCAVKHLSAALFHVAKGAMSKDVFPDPYMVEVCTAYINLVEVKAGYHSHLWYAVGALVRAEERMAPRGDDREYVAREARLMLEQGGEEAVIDALNCLHEGTCPDHADWAAAHLSEAKRELPAMADDMCMHDLIGAIERVRKEFFDLPPSTVPGGETQTGKEP